MCFKSMSKYGGQVPFNNFCLVSSSTVRHSISGYLGIMFGHDDLCQALGLVTFQRKSAHQALFKRRNFTNYAGFRRLHSSLGYIDYKPFHMCRFWQINHCLFLFLVFHLPPQIFIFNFRLYTAYRKLHPVITNWCIHKTIDSSSF